MFIVGVVSLIGTLATDSTITEGNSIDTDYLFNIVLGDRTNREIVIPSYDSKIVDIKISNPNDFNMSYLLYLEGANSNISIINISDTEASGVLNSKNTNLIKVFIQNNGDTDITVSIKEVVGFERESLSAPSNGTAISKGPYYKAVVKPNDKTYGKVKPNIKLSAKNGTVKYSIIPNTEYKYKSNTCNGTVVDNILTISNITSNISCEVVFEPIDVTVNFEGNIFSMSSDLLVVNGLTVSYDPKTSYVTINGTPTQYNSSLDFLNDLVFALGEEYVVKTTYISGSVENSGTGGGCFVAEVRPSDNSQVSTRNYVNMGFITTGTDEDKLTINSAAVSEGKKLEYWIWFQNPSDWEFIDYVFKLEIIKSESKTIKYNEKYGTLPTPTREGYTFAGWYTGENGTGDIIDSNTLVSNSNTHTLYAHWTSSDTTKPTCSLSANESTITATASDNVGIAYQGWSSSYSGTNETSKVITAGTHTYYVKDISGNTNTCSIDIATTQSKSSTSYGWTSASKSYVGSCYCCKGQGGTTTGSHVNCNSSTGTCSCHSGTSICNSTCTAKYSCTWGEVVGTQCRLTYTSIEYYCDTDYVKINDNWCYK